MTKEALYDSLNYVNHSREKRSEMAQLILQNPDLVRPPLLQIAFDVDDPISNRACWVMEFTAKEHLDYLLSHIDTFVENIHRVHQDSAVRPIARSVSFLHLPIFQKLPIRFNKHSPFPI